MSFRSKFTDSLEIVHLKVERVHAKVNPYSPDHFSPGSHDDGARAYAEILTTETITDVHKDAWTHQVLALAAGFSSLYALEAHLRATGHEPSESGTLELLEDIAGSEVDKLIAARELFWIDSAKARRNASKQAHHLARRRYKDAASFAVARAEDGPAHHYKHGTSAPFRVAHLLEDDAAEEEVKEVKRHGLHWRWKSH
ncbi:hypothetical protein AURDEDRAFT_151669 [Auricularia subglabra TFB-10046 SS5]|nr:hypothetical protein AURDEDRAFT_151669 [Auricularia subglabra TFB-10046 SS5]